MGNVVITLDEHAVAVVLLHGEHPREEAASAVLTRHWRRDGTGSAGNRRRAGRATAWHRETAGWLEARFLPEVSRLLRHANPNVTATVYASMAGNAVETLQDRLSGLSVAAGGAS